MTSNVVPPTIMKRATASPAMRAITDKNELEGTAYVELLAGPYREKCWVDGSLFFDEETFSYVETVFERHLANYDHYAFTEVSRENWSDINRDLKEMQSSLQESRAPDAQALFSLCDHIRRWGSDKVALFGCITVLGL